MSTTLPSEARNVFLKTPEGLETPSFRVLADPEEVSEGHRALTDHACDHHEGAL
jgi:hypothetical protein